MTLQETSLKEKEAIKIENDLKKLKSAVEKVKDPNARKKLMHHLHKLEKIVSNILTNAVKYTHEGHIKLGYIVEDNGLRIYCEDTGSGIPKDKLEKI